MCLRPPAPGGDEDQRLVDQLRAGELTAGELLARLQRHASSSARYLCRRGQAYRARSATTRKYIEGARKRIAGHFAPRHNAVMEAIVEKARSYLDRRRGERVTLEELASAVGASRSTCSAGSKRPLASRPATIRDAQRVEAVKSSLKNGSRVTDAVFEAGYGSVVALLRESRISA
jgi:AraC-like DNA-binding protein